MKISELIAELERAKGILGDVIVYHSPDEVKTVDIIQVDEELEAHVYLK